MTENQRFTDSCCTHIAIKCIGSNVQKSTNISTIPDHSKLSYLSLLDEMSESMSAPNHPKRVHSQHLLVVSHCQPAVGGLRTDYACVVY